MQPIFDMHCHYGFAPNPEQLMREAAELGIGAFSCGVEPPAEAWPVVACGLGLHPWWIADGRCGASEVDLFCKLAKTTPFVGEIGLDFGKKCLSFEGSRERQIAAFEAAIRACEGERKLLSLHAVQSASVILDLLAKSPQEHDAIFHWFSGTSDELTAAVKAGCYFSINPRMLETKRGREYARVIPAGQLLLETDAPSDEGMPYTAEQQRAELDAMLVRLSEIRGVSADELGKTIANTSMRLLNRASA